MSWYPLICYSSYVLPVTTCKDFPLTYNGYLYHIPPLENWTQAAIYKFSHWQYKPIIYLSSGEISYTLSQIMYTFLCIPIHWYYCSTDSIIYWYFRYQYHEQKGSDINTNIIYSLMVRSLYVCANLLYCS